MRVGITVTTIVEVGDSTEAEILARRFAGYIDGVLERNQLVLSYTSALTYTFDEPRHTGEMVKLENVDKGFKGEREDV